jgi:hypothetical protein
MVPLAVGVTAFFCPCDTDSCGCGRSLWKCNPRQQAMMAVPLPSQRDDWDIPGYGRTNCGKPGLMCLPFAKCGSVRPALMKRPGDDADGFRACPLRQCGKSRRRPQAYRPGPSAAPRRPWAARPSRSAANRRQDLPRPMGIAAAATCHRMATPFRRGEGNASGKTTAGWETVSRHLVELRWGLANGARPKKEILLWPVPAMRISDGKPPRCSPDLTALADAPETPPKKCCHSAENFFSAY